MKKSNLWKRIAAVAMSAVMMLGMVSIVSAATIDTTAQGTLQIEKLKTGGTSNSTDGIGNVTFKYLNVGGFALTTGDSATDAGVNGFTISNTNLETILKGKGLDELDKTADGDSVYDGAAIQTALAAAVKENKEGVEALVADGVEGVETLTTAANGFTDSVNVAQGIYLIVETDAPTEVTRMSDPFILSVPTLDPISQTWNYDVVAQPKNDYINNPPVPQKVMLDESGNVVMDDDGNPATDVSEMIGKEISFRISTTIPTMAGTLEKFVLTDTVSEGLDMGTVTQVKVTAKTTGADVDLTNDTSIYKNNGISISGRTLTVEFDETEIQKRAQQATDAYTSIEVEYKAKLNKDAFVITTDENANTNTFTVSYTNDPQNDVDTELRIDTYGFTLQKNNENSVALAGAKFKLYDSVDSTTPLTFYTELDADGKVVETTATEEVTTSDADDATKGQASFYGLKEGTYYLEETQAPNGYNLLKERVEIEVTANTTLEGVDITIINTKGFELPSTGGMGTIIFTVGGIVIMLGAAMMLVRANKRSKAN